MRVTIEECAERISSKESIGIIISGCGALVTRTNVKIICLIENNCNGLYTNGYYQYVDHLVMKK